MSRNEWLTGISLELVSWNFANFLWFNTGSARKLLLFGDW